jgi:hypothetical protein
LTGPLRTDGLRALLTGLVDYAGLFPPAALAPAPAVAEYRRHRGEPAAWLLGRFIAPAARLAELAPLMADERPDGHTWPCSVLVGSGEDPQVALSAVPAQVGAVADFESHSGGATPVEVLETPLPAAAAGSEAAAFVPRLAGELAQAGLGGRSLYVEAPAGGDDKAVIAAVAAAHRSGGFPRVGAKLRCGGLVAAAFPTVERVAGFIVTCRDHGVPLKATAGLHHPVRHRAAEPDVMMHGFLNVFGAAALAWGADLDPAEVAACVAETDPTAFTCDDAGFAWRDRGLDADALAAVRRGWLGGFGSCSFAEPRDDLRNLGLL